MAGITAQGATFIFAGFSGHVTGINVESPVAELADMTSATDRASMMMLVPTGSWSGGSVTVDYLANGGPLPTSLVRARGLLTFAAPQFRYVINVILESATVTAQTGELVRGTARFRPTDVY